MTTGARPCPPDARRVLVCRLDSMGDVLLAGPAVRAVAARARVTLLVGPEGRGAAELLPGVEEVLEFSAPWVPIDPDPVDPAAVDALVAAVRGRGIDAALILTSYHQSPLPLALLLRLAGVGWVGADSVDYPGALLDLRHRRDDTLHEAEAALALATAAGFPADGSGSRLAVHRPLPPVGRHTGPEPYVVLHPGAAQPARRPSAESSAAFARALAGAGHRVLVTGSPAETTRCAEVAGDHATDLSGRLSLAELAAVLAGARVAVVPNTGPAHLAAAVGTPVVSLFAPVVPAQWWQPYGVPLVRLGRPDAPCQGTRARRCPVPGHPCLDSVDPDEVVRAVDHLTTGTPASHRGAA